MMLFASRYVIVEVGGCGVCHLNGFVKTALGS
jgi:hypothetical protein